MPTVSRPVTNATHGSIFLEQFLDSRAQQQTKVRIAFGLVGDELEKLSLGRTNVTDAGLIHLKGLVELQLLYLDETKTSDVGLMNLKGLKQLQDLDLRATKVSDTGLENFKGLTRLKSLNLQQTRVSDGAVRDLQRALPNCQIVY